MTFRPHVYDSVMPLGVEPRKTLDSGSEFDSCTGGPDANSILPACEVVNP